MGRDGDRLGRRELAAHDNARSHHSILAGERRAQSQRWRILNSAKRSGTGKALQLRPRARALRSQRTGRQNNRRRCLKQSAEEQLVQPTIIYEFPTAVSPLSKQKPDEPDWTERWEIFAGKMEIANGFSELNDPEDQRRRFEGQLQERERGDEEAHQMDEDYIRALSYGMPPAGGVGRRSRPPGHAAD